MVVYADQIITERYAPGFSADTTMISWSMAKSFTNALVGILVGQGKLSLDETGARFPNGAILMMIAGPSPSTS